MRLKGRLLVEGKDDQHTLWALLEHYNLPQTFKVVEKQGYENLLESLDVEIDNSEIETLGIVVDADTDLRSRWQSVRDILLKMGYSNTPQEPEIEGTIISQPGRATVGVWIMPDNQLPGMLEDFVRLLVHEKDKALWDRAVRSVKAIPKKERMFPEIHLAKVHLHTWLAWQEEPGTPIGLAITKRYFDANLPEAQRFIAWLRRLFVEDVENSPDSGN